MVKNSIWAVLLLLLMGCSGPGLQQLPGDSNIPGLASPVVLAPDTTVIQLGDFIMNPGMIRMGR